MVTCINPDLIMLNVYLHENILINSEVKSVDFILVLG